MPEQLEDYEFTSKARYDWDTLMDGKVYRISADEITAKVRSFTSSASSQASKRGKKLRSQVELDSSGEAIAVVLQAK